MSEIIHDEVESLINLLRHFDCQKEKELQDLLGKMKAAVTRIEAERRPKGYFTKKRFEWLGIDPTEKLEVVTLLGILNKCESDIAEIFEKEIKEWSESICGHFDKSDFAAALKHLKSEICGD